MAILLILGLIATVLWRLVIDRPDQKLTITLIPNPGGPAVLIRLPEGNFVLVNGGHSGRELAAALESWLPPTQRQLAGMFLTTADNTFLSGLPDVVGRWQPDLLYWPDEVAASNSGKEITNLLGMGGETLETGMIFDLGSGVRLSIPAASQSEAALRLTYGNFDALLSGGIGISDFQQKSGRIGLHLVDSGGPGEHPAGRGAATGQWDGDRGRSVYTIPGSAGATLVGAGPAKLDPDS